MADKRILLVWPIFTHVYPIAFRDFMAACLKGCRELPDYKFDVFVLERQLLHSAMNNAVTAFLANPEYVAMVAFDDDCLPPMHSLIKLVGHFERGEHYVAAYGFMRDFPYTTTVGRYFKEGPTLLADTGDWRGFYWIDDINDLRVKADEHDLAEVDFCGLPMVLWSRTLLDAIEKPAFGHSDNKGGQMTHDIHIARRAKASNFTIKVDTSLECSHIGAPTIITSESREAGRRYRQEADAAAEADKVKAMPPQ